jgi:hypothetical protein
MRVGTRVITQPDSHCQQMAEVGYKNWYTAEEINWSSTAISFLQLQLLLQRQINHKERNVSN